MALLSFSKDDFLIMGLELKVIAPRIDRNKRETNVVGFQDFYYATPKACEELFRDIQDEDLGDATIKRPNPEYLILAL